MTFLDKLIIGLALALVLLLVSDRAGMTPDVPTVPPPIPGKGLRVAFWEETRLLDKLKPSQRNIASSREVADYLNEHCAKESSGQPAWRILDPDDDVSAESVSWQGAKKAWVSSKLEQPGLMVSDGKRGVVRPLPDTLEETMRVLKKFGGR